MDLIYIGKLVNTHGINGEVRIISDFEYKKDVFKINNIIYIENEKYRIESYRQHKNYDMVILSDIDSIEKAEVLKGKPVYINREDYSFEGYLRNDLIGLSVYDGNEYKGNIVDVKLSGLYDLLVVDGRKKHMIPNIPEFIEKIDLDNGRVYVKYIKGLDHED